MRLSDYVVLYRTSGKPQIRDCTFSGELEFNQNNVDTIRHLRQNSSNAFEELLVDGELLLDGDQFPKNGQNIEFLIRLPADSANTFHANIADLIQNAPQISRGEMPSDFYLVDIDYYSKEGIRPAKIENLSAISLLINRLSELAHYHDAKMTNHHFKLIFLQPNPSEPATPVELVTDIDEQMLEYDPPNICLVEDLCQGNIQIDPHFNAKRGVFSVTLTEFLSKNISEQGDFDYLVKNWTNFILLYQNNLGTYLSGFAFHKASREVAEAEFEVAEKFSKVISEIAGKLLSIPVSFAVVIAVAKSSAFIESSLLVFGLLLAAVIVSGAVRNQQLQLKRINHAKSMVFKSLEGKRDNYPEDLKLAILDATNNLDKNEKNLRQLLWVYRCLSWIPVFAGLLFVVSKFS